MLFCFTTGLSACGGDEDESIKDDVPTPELYGPKHGTGWVEQAYDYYIQKPWNLNLEERYTYDKENDEHTFKNNQRGMSLLSKAIPYFFPL